MWLELKRENRFEHAIYTYVLLDPKAIDILSGCGQKLSILRGSLFASPLGRP